MNKYDQGKQRMQEILGNKTNDIIQHFESISPDFAKYVVEHAYGEIYTRKSFSDKNRELAAIACLIGQNNTGLPLRSHLNGMLNVGWSKEEIIELIIFLTSYAGFPATVGVLGILKEVLVERQLL